jgi:hypothetical protein
MQSNLKFMEVRFLTYIVRRIPTHNIQLEHRFSTRTISDWAISAERLRWITWRAALKRSAVLTTLEIDKSKFGLRKFNRGGAVKGQWVFGGIERESGNLFLVPVPDRSTDTLMAVITDWIETGTTVSSDCWAAYLDDHG